MNSLFRRRRLPHLDVAGGTYFVTAALAGSAPAQGQARRRAGAARAASLPQAATPRTRVALPTWIKGRHEEWERTLDLRPTVKWLARADLAHLVVEAILHGNGSQYQLLAYVVMPSHMHIVFQPADPENNSSITSERASHQRVRTPRQRIMHSIRSFSGRACNRLLGRTGTFWQHECYDRWLRDDEDIDGAVEYVIQNPVAAGLCHRAEDWPFSSARMLHEEPDKP
jgi:REP element-mobilizing transposase RayT